MVNRGSIRRAGMAPSRASPDIAPADFYLPLEQAWADKAGAFFFLHIRSNECNEEPALAPVCALDLLLSQSLT
jgi:hypothetical protein